MTRFSHGAESEFLSVIRAANTTERRLYIVFSSKVHFCFFLPNHRVRTFKTLRVRNRHLATVIRLSYASPARHSRSRTVSLNHVFHANVLTRSTNDRRYLSPTRSATIRVRQDTCFAKTYVRVSVRVSCVIQNDKKYF